MLIGSHNSMSYLKPTKWYLNPFRFMARCQRKTLEEQYENYNARMFDFRVKFDGTTPKFRHGLMEYDADVYEYLKYLNSKKDTVVRIILEDTKESLTQEVLFIKFCSKIKKKYKGIKFIGGIRKGDWKTLYSFGNEVTYLDKYSSNNKEKSPVTGTILDDLWPWLYAKFNNKKNIKLGTTKDYLLIDFVDIQ